MRSRTNASSTTWWAKFLTDLPAAFPPTRGLRRPPPCGDGSSPARSLRWVSPGPPPPCRAVSRRRSAAPCGGWPRRARSPARRSAPSTAGTPRSRPRRPVATTVPQAVHDHCADVAEQDAADLGQGAWRCSANHTPMPKNVVNSEWANGAMISRIAAVNSESPTVSPPPM